MPGKTRHPEIPRHGHCRFNEAPAKCRGKRRGRRDGGPDRTGFNEAPAKCRGKRGAPSSSPPRRRRFNEAPAKCRGKQVVLRLVGRDRGASMRPQRNAGENGRRPGVSGEQRRASMRPQRNAGENRGGGGARSLADPASMRPQRNAGENRTISRPPHLIELLQ